MRNSLLLLVLALTAACAGPTTTIEQSWKAPRSSLNFNRVVVLYDGEDGAVRRNAEDQLAGRLRWYGARAVQAYTLLSPADSKPEIARAKLRDQGFDGLIVMKVIEKDKEVDYYGGYYGGYWGGWYGGYGPYDSYVYVETIVRVETTAYSLADGKLVFSTISRTEDDDDDGDGDSRAVLDQVTSHVASDLGQRGVVATRPPPPAQTAAR